MLKDTKGQSEQKMRDQSISKIKEIVSFEDQYKKNIDNGSYKDKYLMSINEVSISQWDAFYRVGTSSDQSILEKYLCCICKDIVNLPAVWCPNCKHSICKNTCFRDYNCFRCPIKCQQKLSATSQIPVSDAKIIENHDFACGEEKCSSFNKVFKYNEYRKHLVTHGIFT